MIQGNYDKILEKISKSSGLKKEEIDRRIEAKRAKLSGLISKEGAAQVVAAELGINFDNEKLKIEELLPGMRKVSVIGKTINLFPVRKFTTKSGVEGKVANFIIADETSNIKVVLWDTNHIELIEKGKISEGRVVEISNASIRENELHLGNFSDLKLSNEILDNVKTEKIVKEKIINDLKTGDSVKVRAFVVQVFDLKFFNVCPECNKKLTLEGESLICNEHGKIIPSKRALITLVLDDGTGIIRSVVFHDFLSGLGITPENEDRLMYQKEDLLGKEMIFFGNVRMNKFFNNIEFIIDGIKPLNLDELISNLEMN